MCGIFGYFFRDDGKLSDEAFARMRDSICHRGPDDYGAHFGRGVGIGNQRLAIIDVASGHQPFVSDDGAIGIVQNGEIYNYVELAAELRAKGVRLRTNSDTEVLLKSYELYGMDFVSSLNGMFTIAIADARDGTMTLVRDRIGVKPLYLHDDGNRTLFASEIKSILAAGVPRDLDPAALHHMLTFNYVPPPLTAFRGISHLMPGHWIRYSRDSRVTRQYWRLEDARPETRSEADWERLFRETIEDAVRIRMRADVPYGAFLSGGLDSSTVVGAMSKFSERVKTFCIGFADPRFDESPFAAEVAAKFDTDHTMERVEPNMTDLWPTTIFHCDQPHGDASFMPMLRLSQLAVQDVKMVLTGDGGDEMFGGYRKYLDFFENDPARDGSDDEFRSAYHRHISVLTEEDKRELYTAGFAASVSGLDSYDVSAEAFGRAANMDRVNQALYHDAALLLPGNNLIKPDRMPMAVSLEARDPFLDPRLMELAFSMPGNLKVAHGQTRYLYKKAVEPILGEALTHRQKQMFTVPIGEWFRSELKTFTHAALLSERALQRGIFDREAVAKMLASHESGERNFTREIRCLIVVELWNRIFIDSQFDKAPSLSDLDLSLELCARV